MSEETHQDRFPLSDVVEQLRKDLAEAVIKSEGKDIRFKVNEIEVELKTVIEEARSGNGGFNFSVLKFGGGFNDKNAETQTIKLKLEPLQKDKETGEDNNVEISAGGRESGLVKRISSKSND